jgi:signal transduction histidine kinase
MINHRIKLDLLIHDLKGPLAVMESGVISLLNREEKYGPLTESQRRVLKRVLRNIKVTQTLVNDALELGRSSEGIIHREKTIISHLINQALIELFDLMSCESTEVLKECKDIKNVKELLQKEGIILEIDEKIWNKEVFLDERKMSQILRNLLSNALKYRKKEVIIQVDENDKCLILSVKDDGEGIPPSYHENIFKCYFQLDQSKEYCVRGHGLGLAGVMILVEDMGGELTLESDVGKGAKFCVRLPLE